MVIYLSSTSSSGISSNNLILSGVIVSAILSAGISFCKYLAQERVSVIVFWLLGSFASSTWTSGLLILLCLIVSFAVFIFYFRDLNLLSLGGKTASSMGVDPKKGEDLTTCLFFSFNRGLCFFFWDNRICGTACSPYGEVSSRSKSPETSACIPYCRRNNVDSGRYLDKGVSPH